MIVRWQELRLRAGLDPFIGSKLYGALVRAGLVEIQAHPFNKVSAGADPEAYRAHFDNLRGLFMGKGAASLGFDADSEPWTAALIEAQSSGKEDYLVETHFIAIARKPVEG